MRSHWQMGALPWGKPSNITDQKYALPILIMKERKWKWKSFSRVQLCNPMDYTLHGILQARILEWVAFPSPGDLPNPRIEPQSPTLQADSLPAEPPGKPKSTRVGSLSLLWRIFLTHELNWGLLHCRQILYQMSYQGSLQNTSLSCIRVNRLSFVPLTRKND